MTCQAHEKMSDALVRWLERELFGFRAIAFAVLMAAAGIVLSISGTNILLLLGEHIGTEHMGDLPGGMIAFRWAYHVGHALIEEYVYRYWFLYVPFQNYRSKRSIIPLFVVSSLLFGYAHGDWTNIFVQGLGGICLSIVFLKCGGMNRKPTKALAYSTVSHASANILLDIILMLAKR